MNKFPPLEKGDRYVCHGCGKTFQHKSKKSAAEQKFVTVHPLTNVDYHTLYYCSDECYDKEFEEKRCPYCGKETLNYKPDNICQTCGHDIVNDPDEDDRRYYEENDIGIHRPEGF